MDQYKCSNSNKFNVDSWNNPYVSYKSILGFRKQQQRQYFKHYNEFCYKHQSLSFDYNSSNCCDSNGVVFCYNERIWLT